MVPQPNNQFSVRQAGYYRNIPDFPTVSGLTAIVPGATGVSGWNTIRSLLDSPTRWTKIYAMSRSPPSKELTDLLSPEQLARVHHLAVDFTGGSEDIAASLSSIKEKDTYVFFYAYVQPKTEPGEEVWTNVGKLEKINVSLFNSFLEALDKADVVPKRIVLQTGGKNYGFLHGRTPQPHVESDRQPRHLGTNFYYPQEDSLFAYCKKHPQTSWNVIRPFGVFGSALKAQMSGLYLLCVYAAVQAHKKEPLYFPGDWSTWQGPSPASTARLTGYLSEWAALNDDCKNQAYNSVDSNAFNNERLFSELARWYGNDKGTTGPIENPSKAEMNIVKGGKDTPLGYGPNTVSYSNIKLLDWAQEDVNKNAWKEIMEASAGAITSNPFDADVVKENFQLLDIFFKLTFTVSMNKARLQGWTGFVDTLEAAFESAQEMATMGLLPPVCVDAARPLV